MRVELMFRWYDLWIGAYWNRESRVLYILPLPMLGVKVSFAHRGQHGQ